MINELDRKIEKIINYFPTLVDNYKTYKTQITKAGCPSCTKNQLLSSLIFKLRKAYESDPLLQENEEVVLFFKPTPARIIKHRDKRRLAKRQPDASGVRPSCLDCCRKHIAKAIITFQESLNAEYANHFWLAIGNLSEAEDETISEYPDLANSIRTIRLTMMADTSYTPDLLFLFDLIDKAMIQQ